ncbi:hypothetical protein CONPUDRAFT_70756 [Coniophora puteana RWD-64-598 SS2]|uniref:Uncharacterized protein n=1 Tax=Coniophora puteana (strain RWD-64-598) TaxID=741705 RepID=A0A5M3MXK0_CONPW|nr:uncharacterized protein CONPUDRAFT_70756 [Coniophora puteana RWD-64-598 SS2]EIW83816.1 hypothetical protein CONPUDRAFT_70756 [Coniophora puteana RWD-64-598 SS2]
MSPSTHFQSSQFNDDSTSDSSRFTIPGSGNKYQAQDYSTLVPNRRDNEEVGCAKIFQLQSFNQNITVTTNQGYPDASTLNNLSPDDWYTIGSVMPDLINNNVGSISLPQLAFSTPGLANATVYDVVAQPNGGLGYATVNATTRDALYMLSTNIETNNESLVEEYGVYLNWTYYDSKNKPQIQNITVYFAECAMSIQTSKAEVDVTTNTLVSWPLSPSDAIAKDWAPFPFKAANTSAEWLPTSLLNAPQSSTWVGACGGGGGSYNIGDLDSYLTQAIGSANQYNNTSEVALFGEQQNPPSINLTVSALESALSHMVAGMVWIAGQSGSKGFTRESGETWMEAQYQYNIMTVASIVMLAAELAITGFKGKKDTVLRGTGILDVLWLTAKLPSLSDHMMDIDMPTSDALRAAGMHKVCLEEELSETSKNRLIMT